MTRAGMPLNEYYTWCIMDVKSKVSQPIYTELIKIDANVLR